MNYVFAIAALASVIGIYVYIGTFMGNKNNNNEINKHLIILSSLVGVLTLIYTIVTFLYFTVNLAEVTPYLLLMQGVTLGVALLAICISSLQVTSA